MINIFWTALRYQLITSLRIKQAVFFTLAFPLLLFTVFASIWGGSYPEYYAFLLTGVCAMTISSEGIFAIGSVMRQYYSSGILRTFKVLPYSIRLHLLALVLSRVLMQGLSFALVISVGWLIFDLQISIALIRDIMLGTLLGLLTFGFLGLCISFAHIEEGYNGKGLGNIIYFALMFLSDTFYPLSEINPSLAPYIKWSPMSALLSILRGDYEAILAFSGWTLLFIGLFTLLWHRFKIKRSRTI